MNSELRRFIRRRVANDHVAEDLLQETFVRVHRNLGALKATEKLAAWVYQIARNVVYDHHRQGDPSWSVLSPDEAIDTDDFQSPGCHNLSWLEPLIETLPEGYRQAVRMAELEEHSQQGIADKLGLSLSGAKSRIQRGREMLKETLQRCCTIQLDARGNVVGCDPKPHQQVCKDCGE